MRRRHTDDSTLVFLAAVNATNYALHLALGLPSTAMILVWWWCSVTEGVKPAAALTMGATKTRSVGRIPSMVRSTTPDLALVLGCVLLRLLDVMVD
jgi:hypothetical protein